jgi:hypothetical protein
MNINNYQLVSAQHLCMHLIKHTLIDLKSQIDTNTVIGAEEI